MTATASPGVTTLQRTLTIGLIGSSTPAICSANGVSQVRSWIGTGVRRVVAVGARTSRMTAPSSARRSVTSA